MNDFNRAQHGADIDLAALQHLEGGPEAQLFLNAGGVELKLFEGHETSFREDDNEMPCPIPDVLGIRRKTSTESH